MYNQHGQNCIHFHTFDGGFVMPGGINHTVARESIQNYGGDSHAE